MLILAPALLVAALLALSGSLAIAAATRIWSVARLQLLAAPRAASIQAEPAISPGSVMRAGLLLGLILLLAALLARAMAVGHVPWSNMHEFSQALAATILASYLVLARRFPIAGLAPAVAALALGLIVFALILPADVRPLPPALQMPLLLTVHVGSAMFAYAIYGVAGVAAAGQILQRRFNGRIGWLPDEAVSADVAHRAVIIGLPVLTAAIVLGSVWANLAWRSYWNNDPKELAAAATWLIYGSYLHLAGRRDRWRATAPWLLVAGFAAIGFTYFAANLVIPGQHSYSGL